MMLSVCCLALASTNAFAKQVGSPSEELTLSIFYHDNGQAMVGAKFRLYLLAEKNSNGKYIASEQFKSYPINISEDAETLRDLAATLEGYVLRDNIPPTDSGTIGENGSVSFPTNSNKLSAGIYLVLGERHTQNGIVYDASPFTIILPAADSTDDESAYHVKVEAKYEFFVDQDNDIDIDQDVITRKVLKVWKDTEKPEDRPNEIKVQLLKNGEVYETVTLNKDNNWRYEWNDLSRDEQWNVVELTPNHYFVTITREGTTFVVTNTHADIINLPPTDTPLSPGKPFLPQTGVLWWPIPLLAAGGVLFLIIGTLLKKRNFHD